MKVRFLPAVMVLLGAGAAEAQEFVRADCAGAVQATSALRFEPGEHAGWYRRFWTGSCKDMPLRCIPGSPNWNDMVGKLVAKGRPDQAEAIRLAACRMGQAIGFEWAREKSVRRIDTGDLRSFMVTLDSAPDVTTGIERVELKVKTALGASR